MTQEMIARLEDDAARWVARMDGDDWDESGEAELSDWLAGDPRRSGALLQAQAAYSMLDRRDDVPDAVVSQRGLSRRWFLAGGGLAAAATIFALLPARRRYETDIGEIRRVPLADGSTAAINTASRVAVDLDGPVRQIRLDRGEVWFQVAEDRARPFLVEIGQVRVQAVGTAFSVRRFERGVDVIVTEGTVEVWTQGANRPRLRLVAGDRAFVGDDAPAVTVATEPSAVDRRLAWRSGKIDLVGQPLSEAVAEFNRYNRRKLEIVDPRLADERFDGIFRTDDPAGFAAMIRASLDVPVDLSNPDRIELGQRPR